MSLLSGSTGLSVFRVGGISTPEEILAGLICNPFAELSGARARDELSVGFVDYFDMTETCFDSVEKIRIDDAVVFAVRIDTKKIPAKVMQIELAEAHEDFLSRNTGLKFVPKAEREAIRDQVKGRLLEKVLPTPKLIHVVWRIADNELLVDTVTKSTLEWVAKLLHDSFPTLELSLVTPIDRAMLINPRALEMNKAQTASILEKVEANAFYWREFLAWILWRTYNTDSRYAVHATGPLLYNQPFTAFADKKIVLSGDISGERKKMTVSGLGSRLPEVQSGLAEGLAVDSMTIILHIDDDTQFSVTVDGQWLAMAGLKVPAIRIERDPNDDPIAERQAAFIDRLGLIGEARQMLDSLLFDYLAMRNGSSGEYTVFLAAFVEWTCGHKEGESRDD